MRGRWPAVVAAVAVLAAGCTAGGDTTTEVDCPDGSTATVPQGRDALPAATLSELGGDEQVHTACWLGQPLVVNFWAEWCGPCREEMPDLEAVHQAAGDLVRFVGVDYEDRVDAALAFAEEVGVTYELVEDPDGTYFDAAGGRGAPYTLLVDADGIVRYRHNGPLTAERLTALLEEHLDVTV